MAEILFNLALLASVFMGVAIGASSVAPAFGPVNSSGSANVFRSALLAGIFALIGSVVQGGNVTETVGSTLLVGDMGIAQAVAILFVGSILVIVSVLTDYPMPTAFTVIGAVIGSAYGFSQSISMPVLQKIVAYWLLVPFAAALLGYISAKLMQRLLPEEGADQYIRALLLISGCYVAYTAGAGSVGLAVGPLTSMDLPMFYLLLMGGLSILAGAWLYSPRIIRAVSFDYSNIGPRRSIAALGSSAILAQIGIFLGVPISFNEAIVASVIGSGMVEGKSNIGKRKILFTIGAWIGAFLLAMALTSVIGRFLL